MEINRKQQYPPQPPRLVSAGVISVMQHSCLRLHEVAVRRRPHRKRPRAACVKLFSTLRHTSNKKMYFHFMYLFRQRGGTFAASLHAAPVEEAILAKKRLFDDSRQAGRRHILFFFCCFFHSGYHKHCFGRHASSVIKRHLLHQ